MRRSPIRPLGAALGWFILVAVLIAAVVLTAPRFTVPTSSRMIQLVAFTPLGLIPALVLLVAASLAGVKSRGRSRTVGWSLAIVGLVATALHLVWLAPLYVGSAPSASPGAALVVMTQNLEYGDAGALAREVRTQNVDVLVVCDLNPAQREAVRTTTIPRDLPYLSEIGSGSTIVHSKYPMSTAVRIAAGSRSLQLATPQLGPIALVALHPTPPYRATEWRRDYGQIVSYLADRAPSAVGLPTVIAGDFNATLDHAPVRAIVGLGFTDSVVQTNGGFTPTWPAADSVRKLGVAIPPLVQIDHVMVSGGLVSTASQTVAVPGADHLGVIVQVRRVAP